MKKIFTTLFTLIMAAGSYAQLTPEITSWKINPGSVTGYNGILADVQTVEYSTANVYVSCTDIPDYTIGPWPNNPNVAQNQGFVYKITRSPQKKTGTFTNIGLGHIGVWSNGVSIFNSDDGQTYNSQGVWHRNAYFFEGKSFDNCKGHPQQQGEYHHHVNPECLYNDMDSTHHSPIIGYMFDGFPVYGIYAYSDTMGNGPIKRMRSSYQLRNITTRDTLPDGTAAPYAGPVVDPINYPLGAFIQDYKYIAGSGDLDGHNGRFCKTPEYPDGIYAYFVTVDSLRNPQYPYTAGITYYGTVQTGNTTPSGPNNPPGHNAISEPVVTYVAVTTGTNEQDEMNSHLFPNPVEDYAFIYIDAASGNNIRGTIYNEQGQKMETIYNLKPGKGNSVDFTSYPQGIYFLHLETKMQTTIQKIVKVR